MVVEPQLVYLHQIQSFFGKIQIYPASAMHLGVIAASFQKMIGDSWGVTAPFGYLLGGVVGNFHSQYAGRASDYF